MSQKVKTETLYSRNSSDGKATFAVTDVPEHKMLFVTAEIIGYEISYEYISYKIIPKGKAMISAKARCEGQLDLYENMYEHGLISKNFDWGDKLFEE